MSKEEIIIKDINYYMSLDYKPEIIKDKEDSGYILQYPELKGCITCADTIKEGLKLLKDAKKSWLGAALEDGISIPEPSNGIKIVGIMKLL